MRLLGCFTKRTIVLDAPAESSRASSHSTSPERMAATPNAPEAAFVPASIPELHPEYAHSEPYCFAAKTDSARLVVDRARVARGQPPLGRAAALREQGLVVVRGPSYNPAAVAEQRAQPQPTSHETSEKLAEQVKERASVPLQVESPSTGGEPFVDSENDDENVNVGNMQRRSKAPRGKKVKKDKVRSKRSVSKPKDREPRTSKQSANAMSDAPRTFASRAQQSDAYLSHRSDDSSQRPMSQLSSRRASDSRHNGTRTYSSSDPDDTDDSVLQDALRRTPPALLAPIMVPRMSTVLGEPPRIDSPSMLSHDSITPSESCARFDDVEEESSSGSVLLTAVGKETVVHMASDSRNHTPIARDARQDLPPVVTDDGLFQSSSAPSSHGGLRAKRKSKPFLPSFPGFDHDEPGMAPDSAYSGEASYKTSDHDEDGLGSLPKATASRQISAGVMSDDIQIVDTSGDDLFQIPSAAAKQAPKQRTEHEEFAFIPRASANAAPQGIMRRASTGTKRKTVSFHDAAPTIIEPNLRPPSKSLPRNVMLSREASDNNEFKDAFDGSNDDSFSALRVRDSVKLASAAMPTMDIPRRTNRELSDSSGTEDSFAMRSSRRVSRVSIRDKDALREASKRRSKAVAQAMSEQIRGVPRSAMLAYADNEVIVTDESKDDESGGSSSHLSFRRSSRPARSIRMPKIEPGKVPQPPPPPPFVPDRGRVRSVRKPPPPPSPIRS